MPTLEKVASLPAKPPKSAPNCFHCGLPCLTQNIALDQKHFCCDGCKLVYELLNTNGLCNYYELQQHPGLSGIQAVRQEKFAFLDDNPIADRLCSFRSEGHSVVTFYLPAVHCASCMWLLEHLRRLNGGVSESRLQFNIKEVTVHFTESKISLRRLAELLAAIGYAPSISLEDGDEKKGLKPARKRLYRLGVAGFCFSFIMMMSFPEYFAEAFGRGGFEARQATIFRSLNLLLGIPVFFFCAGEFFSNAWAGWKAKTLHIDAPIALAILITFSRSVWEILSGTGGGYLDSMSGIVFFMLIGRVVQERTYQSLSFHRNYKSYFPIAVTRLAPEGAQTCSLHDLKPGDIVQLHNEEIVPADSRLLEGTARMDYSFVTGESEPQKVAVGERLYAGGRQTGEALKVQIEKLVAGSYLTDLWNHSAFARDKEAEGRRGSSIHHLSRYFTIALFTAAALTALYWALVNPDLILTSVTAMLIVACPCALLLCATFTNGNLLRLFSGSGLFLRDASVIEPLGKISHIAFDKTGTLTKGTEVEILSGKPLSEGEKSLLFSVVKSSRHPYSKALAAWCAGGAECALENWQEVAGNGIKAVVAGTAVEVGTAAFCGVSQTVAGANVYVKMGLEAYAFAITPQIRKGLAGIIVQLRKRFVLSLLSGDKPIARKTMQKLFGDESRVLFEQQPADKLAYIEQLQKGGAKVLMVGDGLNDAGALQQSDVGITLAEDINNFTPACDAILDAAHFSKLPQLLTLARAGRRIITLAFIVSILYNIIGLSIAVQGKMHPMIAAILMPASTLTIVLLSTGASQVTAWWLFKARGIEGLKD
jgi:Cu+-exporting ATPase